MVKDKLKPKANRKGGTRKSKKGDSSEEGDDDNSDDKENGETNDKGDRLQELKKKYNHQRAITKGSAAENIDFIQHVIEDCDKMVTKPNAFAEMASGLTGEQLKTLIEKELFSSDFHLTYNCRAIATFFFEKALTKIDQVTSYLNSVKDLTTLAVSTAYIAEYGVAGSSNIQHRLFRKSMLALLASGGAPARSGQSAIGRLFGLR